MVKKAAIYAQEFMDVFKEKKKENMEDPLIDTVIIICQRLIEEIKEIMLSRRATSNIAFEAVVKEQEQKWSAIVRRLNPSELPFIPCSNAFRYVWDTFKTREMIKSYYNKSRGELI